MRYILASVVAGHNVLHRFFAREVRSESLGSTTAVVVGGESSISFEVTRSSTPMSFADGHIWAMRILTGISWGNSPARSADRFRIFDEA